MRDFNVSGYLIGVDGNKFIIKVDDEYIEQTAFIKSLHNKNVQLGNYITINFKSAQFNIKDLNWNEPKDLIGVHLEFRCTTKIYHIKNKLYTPKNLDVGNTYIPDNMYYDIVSFSAKTIKNIN